MTASLPGRCISAILILESRPVIKTADYQFCFSHHEASLMKHISAKLPLTDLIRVLEMVLAIQWLYWKQDLKDSRPMNSGAAIVGVTSYFSDNMFSL